MSRYTPVQQLAANLLLKKPQSAPETAKALEVTEEEAKKALEALLKVGVAEVSGSQYALKAHIIEEMRRRQELKEKDKFKIRVRAVIEVQSVSEQLLKKAMEDLAKGLRQSPVFTIYRLETGQPQEQDDLWSSYLDAEFSVQDFASLVKFIFLYGPSSLEVLKPEKIELGNYDFEDGLLEMIDISSKYAGFVAERLKKEELEQFNRKLFGQNG